MNRWKKFTRHYNLHLRDGAWKEEILRLLEQDRTDPPPDGGIVFAGSSSIAKWGTLAEDMSPLPVIRRGFGGSTIMDSTYFAGEIITRYKPKMVVLYAGDNDIYFYNKYHFPGDPASKVLEDFNSFTKKIHETLPETVIIFLSIKPSLSREHLWSQMMVANELVREHAGSDERLVYIDVATTLLREDGTVRKELFNRDGLHLNKRGYAVWVATIKPTIIRYYNN
ncbi:MAG: GDSL-type esterase/lipase family protein [Promethearchaeota archaeon]